MDPQAIESMIAVIDDQGHHEWVTERLPCMPLYMQGFRLPVDFIVTPDGRLNFLRHLMALHRSLLGEYEKHGLRICHLTGENDSGKEVCIFLDIYDLKRAKPHIQYLARCQMARRALERALHHQGVMHKDVIHMMGRCVWASRRKGEWKNK